MKELTVTSEFEFDLARSLLLGKYVGAWGVPSARKKFTFNQEDLAEIYFFHSDGVVRLCSIGCFRIKSESSLRYEVLTVFDTGDRGYSEDAATEFMSDCLQFVFNSIDELATPKLVDYVFEDKRSRIILFDEARGEDDSIANFAFGKDRIQLAWAAQLTPRELQIIKSRGMKHFDGMVDSGEINLLKLSRRNGLK